MDSGSREPRHCRLTTSARVRQGTRQLTADKQAVQVVALEWPADFPQETRLLHKTRHRGAGEGDGEVASAEEIRSYPWTLREERYQPY